MSRGVEAAVHAARTYLCNLQPDQVIMKIDFKNAFNSIRRDKMMLAVEEFIPELLPFIHSAYHSPSFLIWGDEVVNSSEGVQQGDPLGPLLFCLTIHKLCAKLKSEFAVFYLDDGTLGGTREDVIDDVKTIEEEAGTLGLQLNREKTELICADHTSRGIVLSALPGLRIINPECANLLGSPLGNADCVNACVSEKIELLRLMGDRLCYLHSHDAITLLRYSFAIPKLLHSLRTAPCFSSPLLPDYDLLLQSLLSKIVNIHFQVDDPAWLQATLPVSAGGLGIRSAVHLAPSAFLASADGSTDLVHHLLPSRLSTTLYPGREDALASWRDGLDQSQSPPVPPTSYRQKMWDLPRIQARADALLPDASDPVTRARLLAVSAKESGAWLNSLPISSLGLRMDNDTIRIAIGLRLGYPLCQPHI